MSCEKEPRAEITESPDLPELYWESDRYNQKEQCRECGSTNRYTRVYFHEIKLQARWLCYCCAVDIQDTKDGIHWKPLTVKPTLTSPSSPSEQ
jgi:hypothetical protein